MKFPTKLVVRLILPIVGIVAAIAVPLTVYFFPKTGHPQDVVFVYMEISAKNEDLGENTEEVQKLAPKAEKRLEQEEYEEAIPYLKQILVLLPEGLKATAATHYNLGIAFAKSHKGKDKKSLEKAVDHYKDALRTFNEKKLLESYAQTQNNLGTAYNALSKLANKEKNLKDAIRHYEMALQFYSIERVAEYYFGVQNNLGIAYSNLSEVKNIKPAEEESYVEQAILHFEKAREGETSENLSEEYQEAYKPLWPKIASQIRKLKKRLRKIHEKSAFEMVTNTFDNDDEGWRVAGAAQGGSGVPDYFSTGGNPGGYISATDDGGGEVWYWQAPKKFLGDVSTAYKQTLTFDLKQSHTGSQFDFLDVILAGKEIKLFFDAADNPGTDWTHYSIPLDESAGWKIEGGSRAATHTEMRTVLSSLTALQIRGEYITGADTGGLDNVILKKSALSGQRDPPKMRVIRVFSAVPTQPSEQFKASVHTDLEVVPHHPYDRTPYHITESFSAELTLEPGQKAMLAGNEEGTANWSVDNFILVEIAAPEETKRFVVGAVEGVDYKGNSLAKLNTIGFVQPPTDLSSYIPTGVPVQVAVSALDYGGTGHVSDLFLVVR